VLTYVEEKERKKGIDCARNAVRKKEELERTLFFEAVLLL
jgi:hypothetical protein